ncbi:aladin [Ziziphus jujuba]|uniref:Aladin n=1 Tax=Ziziphus jujuba TaxID=326968 RepID=A0ABM4A4N6_ZIZJJ|nr:aladin [Ziziphus jujuba var. spinosa]XP_060671691.1 aladin [Ziziphus jujuba]
MASFPPPGTVTVCEINRELITADTLSDDRARDTYGKLLGMVFSPVAFQLDQPVQPPSPEGDAEGAVTTGRKSTIGTLQGIFTDSLKRLFHPNDVNLLPEVDLQGVSWHQHKHIIAFISGSNQVIVRDYEDSEGKDPCILANEYQRDVKVLEWRPNGGRTLSVACNGGICIWAASYPGNAASVRSGAASFLGTLSRGSGIRYILVDFLKSQNNEQISALSWSPDGRFLASASYESSSFTIWDVAQGLGTPFRRGLGGISLLKWSPTGDYFFSAKFDGTFYLWETNTWTSEPWSSTSGFVTGATWDPDGRMILLAFSESSTLGSVHFASKPPSLDAHLLPIELPEIMSLTNSQGIEKIAWDASGERLAVSFKGGDDLYRGLIGIYDARRTPLVSASLVGFIRGPGENPKPIAFSFHDKFKQGPLLSVCWSTGFCCTYPLIFRSHVLP